jgi:hypothetical protein
MHTAVMAAAGIAIPCLQNLRMTETCGKVCFAVLQCRAQASPIRTYISAASGRGAPQTAQHAGGLWARSAQQNVRPDSSVGGSR